jgi:hypothetical protein
MLSYLLICIIRNCLIHMSIVVNFIWIFLFWQIVSSNMYVFKILRHTDEVCGWNFFFDSISTMDKKMVLGLMDFVSDSNFLLSMNMSCSVRVHICSRFWQKSFVCFLVQEKIDCFLPKGRRPDVEENWPQLI